MPSATIVSTWREGSDACMAVRVSEGAGKGNIEYIGRVPFDETFQGLTTAQKKQALVDACKATRDAQTTTAPALPSMTGTVTV